MDDFFLYSIVKDRFVTSVLKFGAGWSPYTLELALYVNFGDEHMSKIRHPDSFKSLTIDTLDKCRK